MRPAIVPLAAVDGLWAYRYTFRRIEKSGILQTLQPALGNNSVILFTLGTGDMDVSKMESALDTCDGFGPQPRAFPDASTPMPRAQIAQESSL